MKGTWDEILDPDSHPTQPKEKQVSLLVKWE